MGDVEAELTSLLASLRALLPTVSPSAAATAAAELEKLQAAFAAISVRRPDGKTAEAETAAVCAEAPSEAAETVASCEKGACKAGSQEPEEVDQAGDNSDQEQVGGEPAAGANAAKNRKKRAAQKAKKQAAREAAVLTPGLEFPEEVRGSVRVFVGPRGRGLQCTRSVKAGEVLIGIPRAWAISNSASGNGGSAGQTALALQLVALRRQRDFRILHMPAYNDMPCFWSDTELEMLRPSMVLEPARNQRGTLEGMYAQLAPKECTVDEFVWAMAMVQSRSFGGGADIVILPFIDLINTDSAPDLDFDVRGTNGGATRGGRKGGKRQNSGEADSAYITVHASRSFEEGEEALVSYNSKKAPSLFSNFLAYGFVPSTGVEYPKGLDPWDRTTSESTLREILARWEKHITALSAAAVMTNPAPNNAEDDTTRRAGIARELLTHEHRMATAEVVAIKKRLTVMADE